MPREARHTVFEFMLACITGQYADLGMARVTFYASLRAYTLWEDFEDMYKVLYALCKGGRDISGFEKNISKLLIHWMEIALQQQKQQQQQQPQIAEKPIPWLSEVLHLLTVIAKFNFAIFEEDEVAQVILATHKAFFSSQHTGDIQACLEFADIVVRYRFVPFEALTPFLQMIAASIVILPDSQQRTKSGNLLTSWPIFHNLLRSHCAHSAILSLCRLLDQQPSRKDSRDIMKGAITLLSETAWGRNDKTGAETYTVSDSVILMYFKRAASKENDGLNGTILKCLIPLLKSDSFNLGLMEWEVFWDIVDVITRFILKITDNNSNNDVQLFNIASAATSSSFCIQQFSIFVDLLIKLHNEKNYKGPVFRFMQVLHQLRTFCSDTTATLLLNYYVTEHSFLPSSHDWLTLLKEIATTFYIHANSVTTTSTLRLTMLNIVSDIYTAVKDFYSEVLLENIVIPMMEMLPSETDINIRQTAIDLLISSLSDCQNDQIFDKLISILQKCTRCQYIDSDALSESEICKGIAAACGLTELFENLLTTSNAKYCAKTFNIITEIANDRADLFCPYGGPKIIALDLLLRLRCPTNHHLYLIEDCVEEVDGVIAFVRSKQRTRRAELEQKKKINTFISVTPAKQRSIDEKMPLPSTQNSTTTFFPAPNIVSYSEHTASENEAVLDMDEMLRSYIRILSHSPNWTVISFVLKRLPQQLSNKHLFCGASNYVNKLRRRLVRWTSSRKFLESVTNLPANIKRNDLLVHAYSLLTVMISYRRIFTEPKQDQDEIVYAFYVGIMQVTSATRLCINSLNVCCYEMPLSVTKMLNEILQRMSQIISVGSVSVHILEFLSSLARLPNLYANFTGDMYKPVFAIALNYLQHSHSQQQQPSPLSTPSASPLLTQGISQKEVSQDALKQYVLTMAYLVITVWFTSIPLRERRKHVPFIIQRLLSGISMGKSIDEQTYTCIDMLSRFTFADVSLAPEKSIVSKILMGDGDGTNTQLSQQQQQQQGSSIKRSQRTWVYGHTLLTLKTAKSTGWIEITIRRPSGTVSMMCYIENKLKSNEIDYRTLPALLMMQYQPDLMAAKILKDRKEEEEADMKNTVPTKAIDSTIHEILSEPKACNDTNPSLNSSVSYSRKIEHTIDPGFLYLQINNYPDIARSMEISPPLPDDEATARTLATFDRIPVVDFHKIGVLYVGKNQKNEVDILANTYGSPDYVRFLNSLGNIQRLKGFKGNTGGLDREMDVDGRYAYFWKDDVTEAVFHIATLMPTNLDRDPQCSAKKRHIGNDYVSIVYNDSGAEYAFDTIPSQFNFINIVVSPHSISTEAVSPSHALIGAEYTFFKVEMQRRPDMPDIGPLSKPTLVSAQSLSGFVRQMAIHANIFAQVFWQSVSAGGKREYVSHWRERLRQIQRVKERLAGKTTTAAVAASASAASTAASLGDPKPGNNSKDNNASFSHESLLDFTKYT
ncbi:hypothetical protein BDF20DRAFT_818205 [Mycotypha africana]|uniref:uncharacterized protein n=1 Tax=Mycotypha africana TaxID=64632 RepID=UPI002301792B|nr:uncharacterized protein BDF20DRAFT_818205 [Mycotypha africana]KAI8982294.1 hypothetical protein BDF20DRAFT_818205 [Mycotypha africana]